MKKVKELAELIFIDLKKILFSFITKNIKERKKIFS